MARERGRGCSMLTVLPTTLNKIPIKLLPLWRNYVLKNVFFFKILPNRIKIKRPKDNWSVFTGRLMCISDDVKSWLPVVSFVTETKSAQAVQMSVYTRLCIDLIFFYFLSASSITFCPFFLTTSVLSLFLFQRQPHRKHWCFLLQQTDWPGEKTR